MWYRTPRSGSCQRSLTRPLQQKTCIHKDGPPGAHIYANDSYTIYEVDGEEQQVSLTFTTIDVLPHQANLHVIAICTEPFPIRKALPGQQICLF